MNIPSAFKLKIQDRPKIFFISLMMIAAIGFRGFIFLISNDGYGADPATRIMIVQNWFEDGGLYYNFFPWPPLHFYLIALSLKIYNNPLFSPRFVSFIFAALSFIPFYQLLKIIFSQRVAFLSLCLLSFFPMHIECSVSTLAEIPFLFFLLWMFYFYFKYTLSDKLSYLVFAAIALTLAAMTRYEAWLFLLVIPLLLIFQKNRNWKHISAFILIGGFFPILWEFNSGFLWLRTKEIDPVSLTYSLQYKLVSWPIFMKDYFGLFSCLVGLSGIFFGLRDKALIRRYTVIFLSLFLFFWYASLTDRVNFRESYMISFGTLFIPFLFYGIERIFGDKKLAWIGNSAVIVTCLYVFMSVLRPPVFHPDVSKVANYFKRHLKAEEKIVLDQYRYQSEGIVLLSGIPWWNVYVSDVERTKILGETDPQSILDFILENKPRFIVTAKDGVFSIEKIHQEIFGRFAGQLELVLATDIYHVYEFKKS